MIPYPTTPNAQDAAHIAQRVLQDRVYSVQPMTTERFSGECIAIDAPTERTKTLGDTQQPPLTCSFDRHGIKYNIKRFARPIDTALTHG